jgi:NADPH2:quinone reductase
MRAAYITETGSAEKIQVGTLPDPVPRGPEVLVRVTAAAVNPIDTYVRGGLVAAALVGITAHLGLVREAKLRPGETVVVSGGSGAVGSMVLQMARALGAHVLATTGSEEGVAYCQALGAERVINYQDEDVLPRITERVPEGVDLWWETGRNVDFDLAIGALGLGGRLILMAGRDARPEFPVGPFYVKCCKLLGFVMFQAPAADQRRAAEAINGWLVEGKLKPTIDRVVPLEETPAMHRLQEENTLAGARTLRGKIVVRMGG